MSMTLAAGKIGQHGTISLFPRSSKRELVVVRAGRNSLHESWLAGDDEQTFDLLVTAYEDGVAALEGDHVATLRLPGRKISGYYDLFRQHPELLDRYEYIALFDDDLFVTKQKFSRLFELGRRYRLEIFQPTLTWDSYFTYGATLFNPCGFRLRYTNCVEMMCPIFSAAQLKQALPLFGLGFEMGIDLIWTRLSDEPYFRFAIIDEVTVKHTRPVNTTKQGYVKDEEFFSQLQRTLDLFDATFRGFVAYAGIDSSGKPIMSRTWIAILTTALLGAFPVTPLPKSRFMRAITDYTRHCLLRPVNLGRIDLARGAGLEASSLGVVLAEP